MAKNEGKKFEEDFENSAIKEHRIVDRIKDSSNFKKTTKNICDYVLYEYPYIYYFELKSTKANSFQITERIIKQHQIDGLLKYSKIKGVYAGFLFNFRERNLKTKKYNAVTYFIPINNFIKLSRHHNSINRKLAKKYGVLVESKKIRTRYRYNVDDLLKKIS